MTPSVDLNERYDVSLHAKRTTGVRIGGRAEKRGRAPEFKINHSLGINLRDRVDEAENGASS